MRLLRSAMVAVCCALLMALAFSATPARSAPPAQDNLLQNADFEGGTYAFNGDPVSSFNQLIAYLAMSTEPGQSIDLTVLREGEVLVLPLVLGERP